MSREQSNYRERERERNGGWGWEEDPERITTARKRESLKETEPEGAIERVTERKWNQMNTLY